MIGFIVLLILVMTIAYLGYPIVSVPTFLINVSLILIIACRSRIDLKENNMHAYYMAAAAFAVMFFIAREYGFMRAFSDFLFNSRILYYTQAAIVIFIFAHISAIVHAAFRQFLKDMKSRSSV